MFMKVFIDSTIHRFRLYELIVTFAYFFFSFTFAIDCFYYIYYAPWINNRIEISLSFTCTHTQCYITHYDKVHWRRKPKERKKNPQQSYLFDVLLHIINEWRLDVVNILKLLFFYTLYHYVKKSHVTNIKLLWMEFSQHKIFM